MLVKTVASGQLIQEGQHVLMAPLDPFAKKVDARTALNDYARNNTVRNDRQSGAARRALPGLRKKEERASQCLETLIEGTIHTASTKIALVRNAIPFVQALRESALKCKKEERSAFRTGTGTGSVCWQFRATVADRHRHPSSKLGKRGSQQLALDFHQGVVSQDLAARRRETTASIQRGILVVSSAKDSMRCC